MLTQKKKKNPSEYLPPEKPHFECVCVGATPGACLAVQNSHALLRHPGLHGLLKSFLINLRCNKTGFQESKTTVEIVYIRRTLS